jgi:hypothetical protein
MLYFSAYKASRSDYCSEIDVDNKQVTGLKNGIRDIEKSGAVCGL